MAVMVLFCGDDEKHVGAIELWHNDPEKSDEMGLVDGYYGTPTCSNSIPAHQVPARLRPARPRLESRHAAHHQGSA